MDPYGQYIVAYPPSVLDFPEVLEQKYRPNQIPKEHCIYSEGRVSGGDTQFTLNTHNGMIHFQLIGNATIGSIELHRPLDFGRYFLTNTLSCGTNGVQLSDTPTDFYIDINGGDSGGGFKLIFKDISGEQLQEQESTVNLSQYAIGMIVDFDEPLTVTDKK